MHDSSEKNRIRALLQGGLASTEEESVWIDRYLLLADKLTERDSEAEEEQRRLAA